MVKRGSKNPVPATANSKIAESKAEALLSGIKTVGKVKLLAAKVEGMKPDAVRNLADTVKAKYPDAEVMAICGGQPVYSYVISVE